MQKVGALQICPVIGEIDGAKHLSQYFASVQTGESPVLRYPGSDVVLFTLSGEGIVRIGDRSFAISPETGVCIKPGEGFQIVNDRSDPITAGGSSSVSRSSATLSQQATAASMPWRAWFGSPGGTLNAATTASPTNCGM